MLLTLPCDNAAFTNAQGVATPRSAQRTVHAPLLLLSGARPARARLARRLERKRLGVLALGRGRGGLRLQRGRGRAGDQRPAIKY